MGQLRNFGLIGEAVSVFLELDCLSVFWSLESDESRSTFPYELIGSFHLSFQNDDCSDSVADSGFEVRRHKNVFRDGVTKIGEIHIH